MKNKLFLLLIFTAFTSLSCEEEKSQTDNPYQESVTGKINLKITGNEFGQGPDVQLWFSGRNPNEHQTFDPTNDPEIGAFSGSRVNTDFSNWKYWFDNSSNRYYIPTVDRAQTNGIPYFSATATIGSANSERDGYLISYRTVVPSDYSFPGTTLDQFTNNSYSGTGSSFKSVWITDLSEDTANGDLVTWTHTNSGNLQTIGNGTSLSSKQRSTGGYTNYSFSLEQLSSGDNSTRFLGYLKSGTNFNSGDMVDIEWSLSSTVSGHIYHNGQRPMTSNRTPLNHAKASFPGWIDPDRNGYGTIESTQVLFGDIYIAQGVHARARIEIGDQANYEDCNWLFIAPPKLWSNTSVEADFFEDEYKKSSYWFITTSEGKRYSGKILKN